MRSVAVGAHCFSQVWAWVWMFWVEVGWDSDGDAFGAGVFVGDFPVGCGVGCEAFGEEPAEHF